MKRFALAFFLVTSLGGCTTVQSMLSGGSVADAAPQSIATAEKGLTLAHLAYQGLGDTLKAAANSGALHGVNATSAKMIFDKAGAALDVADTADEAANAQGIINAVSQTNDLITQASALVNPKVTK